MRVATYKAGTMVPPAVQKVTPLDQQVLPMCSGDALIVAHGITGAPTWFHGTPWPKLPWWYKLPWALKRRYLRWRGRKIEATVDSEGIVMIKVL